MEKLTKNRMVYLLAHYEGVAAQSKSDAGDRDGAGRLFSSAINKYEHLASLRKDDERMTMLNEALKLARRAQNPAETYRIISRISGLIALPGDGMPFVELKPGRFSGEFISGIAKTFTVIRDNNASYVYRVRLDRDAFGRLVEMFEDSELRELVSAARERLVGTGSGVPVVDDERKGMVVEFDYNYTGYLMISSKHQSDNHSYAVNIVNVYGTALDGIVS